MSIRSCYSALLRSISRWQSLERFVRVAAILLFASASSVVGAQSPTPRSAWLQNLRPMMSNGLCNGTGSPFARIYKGTAEACVQDVNRLFEFCTTKEPAVVLPAELSSVPQANWYGQIIAECIGAYYQGSVAIDGFHAVQRACHATMENGNFRSWCEKPGMGGK